MAATISLQNVSSHSGYFNIEIKVKNTSNSPLSGARLRPLYITMPDGSVIADPQFGNPQNASYDPIVVASMNLPTISPGATYVNTCMLPVISAIYQGPFPHICQFFVLQESVAILSNKLNVSLTPVTEAFFSDPIISSLHNNTDILNYQDTISNTNYANSFTSGLDIQNLGTTANLQMLSSSTLDTQMYRLLGLDSNGKVLSERGLLNGTTTINSRSSFSYLYDFYLSSPANGTVTVSQSSTVYVTVPVTFTRSPGFRFADNRPRLIHSLDIGSDMTVYVKLTTQEFDLSSVEAPLFENNFVGPNCIVYFYPPIYVPINSIVRGYIKVDTNPANVYGILTTAPVLGF